jgi:hypothetical protein
VESPEHQKRAVREYFLGQSGGGVSITHLEKVASERVLDRRHDIWDVHASDGRWWVITQPTNLYSQDRFPSMDETLSFHVGLILRVMSNDDKEPNAGIQEVGRLSGTWRRFEQAAESFDAAEEAEDFQAIGMRCREVLLTFIREATSDEMVPAGQEPPKTGDFVHWSEYLSQYIASGQSRARLRSYIQSSLAETWRYVNWLTHARNATRFDADLALRMVNDNMGLTSLVLIRSERAVPGRCPMCGSYQLYSDFRIELMEAGVDDPYVTLCESCGWEDDEDSEPDGELQQSRSDEEE